MKTYFLLRDNKENGPYSVEDLKKFILKPYDLIWIDGQSTGWQNPTEINELKAFVCTKKKAKNIPVYNKNQSKKNEDQSQVFVALPSQNATLSTTGNKNFIADNTVSETKLSPPLPALKERYSEHLTEKKIFHKTVYRPNAFWLVGLVGGLIVCAVFIKKFVDGYGEENLNEGINSEASIIDIPKKTTTTSIAFQDITTEATVIDTEAKEKQKK